MMKLQKDAWRSQVGFSPEIGRTNQRLFDNTLSREAREEALREWIQHHQPCLFGRIAAKNDLLSYCILTKSDLAGSDESIRDIIQAARTEWTRAGYQGKKNGFIILAVCEELASATPNAELLRLAQQLCQLYLIDVEEEVVPDKVYMDEIFLEKPGPDTATWKWHAGVNFFGAQGDKRWWQDHRIPGGIGFSVNSVGHMVKSGILARAMIQMEKELDTETGNWPYGKVDSLGKALGLAMLTIDHASEAISGKATNLMGIPRGEDGELVTKPPAILPQNIADKNFETYQGYYHTDHTIPSIYFRPDVVRPEQIPQQYLDFTYLFRTGSASFITMGGGRRIRNDEAQPGVTEAEAKLARMTEVQVPIENYPRLVKAISDH
ncbi:hypothetical protein AYO44_17940 [Planctomycetaceae bacterium SCGC AG-212-F19]|nr:hypothetical protein AYO44_17940 [Planctomycetaceae bacterium SCGC AG-212-F19]